LAQNALAEAADAREGLLLESNSDTALDQLDRSIERHQRVVLKCDRIEPLLLAQLRDRRQAYRQKHFAALAERYRGAVSEYCEVMRNALALKREIAGIRAAGERAGFNEARLLFDVPYLQASDPDHFEFATNAQLASVSLRPQPEAVRMRFTRACYLYRLGEVAAFSEEDANLYLQAGVAERVLDEVSL
jgi:hypothetical protein